MGLSLIEERQYLLTSYPAAIHRLTQQHITKSDKHGDVGLQTLDLGLVGLGIKSRMITDECLVFCRMQEDIQVQLVNALELPGCP